MMTSGRARRWLTLAGVGVVSLVAGGVIGYWLLIEKPIEVRTIAWRPERSFGEKALIWGE